MNIPKEIIEAAKRLKNISEGKQKSYFEMNGKVVYWIDQEFKDRIFVLNWAIKEVLAWENQIQGGP